MNQSDRQGIVEVLIGSMLWGSIGVFVLWMDRLGSSSALTAFLRMAFAFLILCIVISCSFVSFPDGVFTSKATNRPPIQAMISGMPAVPYIPPCVFHAKQAGTAFKYRRIAFTMSFSAMVILHDWTAGQIWRGFPTSYIFSLFTIKLQYEISNENQLSMVKVSLGLLFCDVCPHCNG